VVRFGFLLKDGLFGRRRFPLGLWRCGSRRVESAGKVKTPRVPHFLSWSPLGVARRGGSVTRAGAAFGL
jgi:hypothetical protein